MRTKTQTAALAVCIAAFSMQFVACKKESAGTNTTIAGSNDNTIADSTTDSSLLKGLVAWYTFNGDVLDHSGNKNNIVFNSAKPAKGKAGIPGTAYSFDGVSSYMQVNNKKSLNPLKITLYALVKPKGFYQGTCHYNLIIAKEYSGNDNGKYELGYSDQQYYGFSGCYQPVAADHEQAYGGYGNGVSAVGVWENSDNIQANNWYALAYTFDGVYSKIYVNGVLKGKYTQSINFVANSSPVFIAKTGSDSYPYNFTGIIDEIRIYNRALSAKQISALYNQSNN